MSTGCQNVSQTDRKIYRAPGRQTEWQYDSMADSRAAKEPALVFLNISLILVLSLQRNIAAAVVAVVTVAVVVK